jgi:hypothetical protein
MTRDEAEKLASVIPNIDGGCDCCVRGFLDDLNALDLPFYWRFGHRTTHITAEESGSVAWDRQDIEVTVEERHG